MCRMTGVGDCETLVSHPGSPHEEVIVGFLHDTVEESVYSVSGTALSVVCLHSGTAARSPMTARPLAVCLPNA